MKRFLPYAVVGSVLFATACVRLPWAITNETAPTASLATYKTVSVGWLDLHEEKWKDYGFDDSNKDKWDESIKDWNQNKFPEFLKQWMPDRTINGVKSKKETAKKDGLVVTFTDVEYVQRTSSAGQFWVGGMAGSDTLELTVHFADAKTGQELTNAKISITATAYGFAGTAFEARVNAAVSNLAYYISQRMSTSQQSTPSSKA